LSAETATLPGLFPGADISRHLSERHLRVDCETQQGTLKQGAIWYRDTVRRVHGGALPGGLGAGVAAAAPG
jgi:hypothetical protein